MRANCFRFESAAIDTAKDVESISTLTFDIENSVEPLKSENPMVPTHRILVRSS